MIKSKHPLYSTWNGMKARCRYISSGSKYENYRGRGIKVCDRWNDFWKFVEDMGDRPPGLTLDRIDNDGNYEPSNCKWSSPTEQAWNRRFKNTSGYANIQWRERDKRWRIKVQVRGRSIDRSRRTLAEALEVRSQIFDLRKKLLQEENKS